MRSMSISFIVSVFDRPQFLNACLASLNVQTHRGSMTVCANSRNSDTLNACKLVCIYFDANYRETGQSCDNCYDSANLAARETTGEWLCFPSDDSLYVCGFTEIMLAEARRTAAGLVYCDCVYRREPPWKAYTVLDVEPRMGRIDKTCFIMRRELFKGFPPHPKGWCDGALVEQLVRDGVKTAKAPGVLVLHQ